MTATTPKFSTRAAIDALMRVDEVIKEQKRLAPLVAHKKIDAAIYFVGMAMTRLTEADPNQVWH